MQAGQPSHETSCLVRGSTSGVGYRFGRLESTAWRWWTRPGCGRGLTGSWSKGCTHIRACPGRGQFEAGSENCQTSSIENRRTEHVPRREPCSPRLSRLPVTAAIMPADRPKGEPQMKNAHSTPATPGLLRRRLTLALLAFSVFVGTFA